MLAILERNGTELIAAKETSQTLSQEREATMFEVGRKYDITILEWGDNGAGPVQLPGRIVEETDGSLVKLVMPAAKMDLGDGVEMESKEEELIINTASLYFVSAKPSE